MPTGRCRLKEHQKYLIFDRLQLIQARKYLSGHNARQGHDSCRRHLIDDGQQASPDGFAHQRRDGGTIAVTERQSRFYCLSLAGRQTRCGARSQRVPLPSIPCPVSNDTAPRDFCGPTFPLRPSGPYRTQSTQTERCMHATRLMTPSFPLAGFASKSNDLGRQGCILRSATEDPMKTLFNIASALERECRATAPSRCLTLNKTPDNSADLAIGSISSRRSEFCEAQFSGARSQAAYI
jgi:hypothetical protein